MLTGQAKCLSYVLNQFGKSYAIAFTPRGIAATNYGLSDSDVATWKEYLKEHPMKGIHGIDDNKLIRINLQVPGVPNYFIIDKKGRIAYNSLLQSKQNDEEMMNFD